MLDFIVTTVQVTQLFETQLTLGIIGMFIVVVVLVFEGEFYVVEEVPSNMQFL